MDILKKIILLASPLLLTECYEDFDPNIDTTPVLCLNSLIKAGEPIDVNITRTWIYTDAAAAKDHSVDDASFQIFANGNPVDNSYIPHEGDHIRLLARSRKYGSAEAEVTVPVASQISSLDFTPRVTDFWATHTQGWGLTATMYFDVKINFGIADNNSTTNYYLLEYKSFSNSHPTDYDDPLNFYQKYPQVSTFSPGQFETSDPVFYEQVSAFEEVMNGAYYDVYFSNRLINKETNDVEFGFSACKFALTGWNGQLEEFDCGWDFTLYFISESLYNWAAYIEQKNGFVFGDMGDWGLSDPIWGYSNVSTGAGVVAAQSSATITLNLHDFLYDYISKECK